MGLEDGDTGSFAPLAAFLAEQAGAKSATIERFDKLSGGAIQENHALDVAFEGGAFEGTQAFVLRTDAPSGVEVSHARAEEFQLLQCAYAKGVCVPEALWACADTDVYERPFYVMRRVSGTAEGHRLVKDQAVIDNGDSLVAHLGAQLAKIHSITPKNQTFDFLTIPEPTPAMGGITRFRGFVDALPGDYPTIEWGLRWLEKHAPKDVDLVLIHHDFRIGNLMMDSGILTGILDWEFAEWSDYHEDLAWFCARCWRFGNFEKEAGGIGNRLAFYDGYQEMSGRRIDPEQIYFWEVYAHMRWAVIAIQQGVRHSSGEERSLHLALTGRVCAELEWELIRMTAPGGHHGTG
jgi:aminoglycoside phosphotransferase (APT) family kinase protein